ncbi:NAD(P)/FAD-dependent oxidoreductase [Niallia circulans]|uniref:NAD(P)/FAD-dependent oxidoreductase n=1 Tax=Niallia TaxID=2837506 RepID=UPI000F459230|nr:NAD(P)/FAD-dependent oxidoreductase [Niallia circulans]AYV66543.1 NAD(P)/FAD-dependent oxidoreductase [Niallia circulans]
MLDCIVIGGGPAGLNASLVLGRARMKTILFDDDKPRNSVTQESHGFITRDGIKPSQFKQLGKEELKKYPDVFFKHQQVTEIKKVNKYFIIFTDQNESYQAKKIILSTGLIDILPDIAGLHHFYGKSIYSCPFCDGWELKDRALAVLAENDHAFHLTKLLFNWSKNLIVCTNGKKILTKEQLDMLNNKNIKVIEHEIDRLYGDKGQLQKIIFKNGEEVDREGGFVTAELQQAVPFAEALGCTLNKMGGVETDALGRTNIEGVYASGDNTLLTPPQLINAASQGSRAASGVIADLINEEF